VARSSSKQRGKTRPHNVAVKQKVKGGETAVPRTRTKNEKEGGGEGLETIGAPEKKRKGDYSHWGELLSISKTYMIKREEAKETCKCDHLESTYGARFLEKKITVLKKKGMRETFNGDLRYGLHGKKHLESGSGGEKRAVWREKKPC